MRGKEKKKDGEIIKEERTAFSFIDSNIHSLLKFSIAFTNGNYVSSVRLPAFIGTNTVLE